MKILRIASKAHRCGEVLEPYVKYLEARTKALILTQWAAVDDVALALLARSRLCGEETMTR